MNVRNKPIPGWYDIVLKDLKVLPENMIAIEDSKICNAKIRSNQKEEKGTLVFDNHTACFTFEKEINSTSPGQACVFYLNNQVLGGGWITNTSN